MPQAALCPRAYDTVPENQQGTLLSLLSLSCGEDPPVPQETSNSSSYSRSSHQAPGKMCLFIQPALRAGLPSEQSNRDGNEIVRRHGHAGPYQAHFHSTFHGSPSGRVGFKLQRDSFTCLAESFQELLESLRVKTKLSPVTAPGPRDWRTLAPRACPPLHAQVLSCHRPWAGPARPHPGRPLLPSAPAVASSSFLPQLSGHPASCPGSPAPRHSCCPVPPPRPLSAHFLASSSVVYLLHRARDQCRHVHSCVLPRAVWQGRAKGLHLTLVSRSALHAATRHQNQPRPQPTPSPTHPFPQPRGLQRPQLKTRRHTGTETLFSAISIKESRLPV